MKYRVVLPGHVENLIADQALYIAEDSIHRALQWERGLREAIERLGETPRANPISVPDTELAGYEVRKLIHGNYLVFYRIDDDAKTVFVEGFRHGARLPER